MKRMSGMFAALMLFLVTVGEAIALPMPVPLQEPAPIPVPAGRSADEVVASINTAMGRHGNWVPESEAPGHIVAHYSVRGHQAWVDIRYTPSVVTLRYSKSFNLHYRIDQEGVRLIHRSYNRWVKTLADDIRSIFVEGASEDAVHLVKLAREPVRNEPLSAFSRFELREVDISPDARRIPVNVASARSLQVHTGYRIKPLLEQWQNAAQAGSANRTLVIEPIVERGGFISSGHYGNRRVVVGYSWIEVRLRCTDAESGALVAERIVSGKSVIPERHYDRQSDDQMLVELTSNIRKALLEDYGEPPQLLQD